ncbi:MAG: CAP domain-containing protein, partial [Bacteroidetes bacterium]|nr:CAP domain-containing protein [Bacteroidota bacterium]
RWEVTIGENCAYGLYSPLDIVMGLLIDEGVSDLGHRKNILNPDYKVIGVAIRPHKSYGTNCVQDFAGGVKGE